MYVFFSYGSIRVSPIVKSPNFLPGRSPPEVYLLLSLVIHSRRRSPAATGLLRSSPFLRESLSSPFARGTLFQGDSSFPVVMPSHFMNIISTFVHRLFLFDTRHIHCCCPMNYAGLITQVIYPLYQFLNLFQIYLGYSQSLLSTCTKLSIPQSFIGFQYLTVCIDPLLRYYSILP